MSERFSFENLFKLNKKPPETGGLERIFSAVILVFLIGFIVVSGFVKKHAAVREQPIIKLEKKAEYVLAEITGLAKIDPGRAMGLAQELKESISGFQNGIRDKKLLNRINDLQQKLIMVQSELGLVRRANLAEFLDPKLLRDGLNVDVLDGNSEKLLIFDSQKNILATVSPVDRSGQIIGGGIDGISSVALGRNSAFGIKEDRIVEFPFGGGEQIEAVKEEEPWSVDSILKWFGGNLYVIDKSASEILKYPAIESSSGKPEFGSRRRWFKPGLNYDLSDVAAVEVDGDIWVLHQGGQISRLRNGSRISFKQALADFVSEPALFSVPPEGDKLWVLSRKDKRVVVLNREAGEFAGLWEADEFGKAQGIVVNEKLGKMFVLVEGKIYVADIK